MRQTLLKPNLVVSFFFLLAVIVSHEPTLTKTNSVLDAGIPLLCAVLSLTTIVGTLVYKRIQRNHAGDIGYLPISSDDSMPGSEDMDEDMDHANAGLGQVTSGRRISVRDALKSLATFVSLGVSIAWLILRSKEDKDTYLYIAPLVSTIAWVSPSSIH